MRCRSSDSLHIDVIRGRRTGSASGKGIVREEGKYILTCSRRKEATGAGVVRKGGVPLSPEGQ